MHFVGHISIYDLANELDSTRVYILEFSFFLNVYCSLNMWVHDVELGIQWGTVDT